MVILDDFSFNCMTLIYRIFAGCLKLSKRPWRKEICTQTSAGTKLLPDLEAGKARLQSLHYQSFCFDLANLDIISGAKSFSLISQHQVKIPKQILFPLPVYVGCHGYQPQWELKCLETAQHCHVYFPLVYMYQLQSSSFTNHINVVNTQTPSSPS